VRQITQLVPDYMVMGERGRTDMAEMEMPVPDNTAPMMTGAGRFGSVEMGGMFSLLEVRRDQKRGDHGDPGWFKHPPGAIACEWTGAWAEPARFASEGQGAMKPVARPAQDIAVTVRKPTGGRPCRPLSTRCRQGRHHPIETNPCHSSPSGRWAPSPRRA
jgi:hypothetical protein